MSTQKKAVPQVSTTTAIPVTSVTPTAVAALSATQAPAAPSDIVPTGFRENLQLMLQGFQTVLPDGVSFPSSDGSLERDAVVAQLQQYVALYATVAQQELALKGGRLALTNGLPAARSLYAVLKSALEAYFGPASPQLAQFGVKPKKARTKPDSATLAARTVKAQETRVIRGTLGKNQRKKAPKFTGTVTAAQAETPASPAAAPAGEGASTSAATPSAATPGAGSTTSSA